MAVAAGDASTAAVGICREPPVHKEHHERTQQQRVARRGCSSEVPEGQIYGVGNTGSEDAECASEGGTA